MRIISALKADIKFQAKQGFYSVYILLTLVYMIILEQVPNKYQNIVVPLVVFSDPTIVGFFFIGGIVMLEKVQGVLDY
ncbi:MAG: ABC transporter permease, partial [Ignavibacteria bacterium]|nr:ABC transporter permease [Ignavibacteria bacterium]